MQVRCPECHYPIELADDNSLRDISCPSCDGSFSLLGDETVEHRAPREQTVGQFELVDQIGAGAYGLVWRARDTELDRTVAVKIPRKDQLDVGETELFLREARAAAQLHHPNIVSVYEVGRQDGAVYIVSDYIDGLSLADWLTDQRPTSREAAELCVKLADALEHAHQAGVIHRDLKPGNIILDRDGEPHITDFGLARREAGEVTVTVEGKILGTPAYMSPEQATGSGHTADRRSDVYSLGVILFELLAGERPFRGNVRMLLQQVVHDEPPSPRRFNATVPRDLETICLKCLEKAPERRYATAGELADELRRYLAGMAIHARPISSMQRAWRRCKRNPVVSSLSAGAFLILVAGLIGVTSQWIRAERNAREARENELAANLETDRAVDAAKEETQARMANERYLYAAHMNLAQQAWEIADIRLVREFLKRHPSGPDRRDLRGFEWFYWWRHCHEDRASMETGVSTRCVRYSPDGRILAAGCVDGTLHLFDAETGQVRNVLAGHLDTVEAVAFSPGQRILAAAVGRFGKPGELKLWYLESGELEAVLDQEIDAVQCVAFSPDGKLLVSGGYEHGKVWDVEARQLKYHLEYPDIEVLCAAFAPDGRTLVTGDVNGKIHFWAPDTGELLETIEAHDATVAELDFSPDGTLMASSAHDKKILLWDAVAREVLHTLDEHAGAVMSVAVSPDGVTVASASTDRTMRLWDAVSGRRLATFRGHEDPVTGVDFSPDGHTIATSARDGTVKLWDPDRPETTVDGRHTGFISDVVYSPDGKVVATASCGFWTDERVSHFTHTPDSTVKLWDAESGRLIRTLEPQAGIEIAKKDRWNSGVLALAYSPDGKTLASAGSYGKIALWDPATGRKKLEWDAPAQHVYDLEFSPDGRFLASADSGTTGNKEDKGEKGDEGDKRDTGGKVQLWDPATGELKQTLSAHRGRVRALAFCRTKPQIASVGSDRVVKVWMLTTRKPTPSTPETETWVMTRSMPGHRHSIGDVAFSPDGEYIATAASDRTIGLFGVNLGRMVTSLKGHSDSVLTVTFSPDGKTVASGSIDQTIKLWDPTTAELRSTLKGHGHWVHCLAFSPDGQTLTSGGGDKQIRFWRAGRDDQTAAALAAGRSIRAVAIPAGAETITNSIGMHLTLIPAGEFLMGTPADENRHGHESQHLVRITKPFYLGVTEVTQEQFRQVMGMNPSHFTNRPQHPVEVVSWQDAVGFCWKLSAMEGKTYRLPTEAEWEYACRAGATSKWCFGDDQAVLEEYAWYGTDSTHPVAQKRPNAWGLYDMHGNVFEWCADYYDGDYYAQSPRDDPQGPAENVCRVFRGGCWREGAEPCRSACRDWRVPGYRHYHLGFRVARDLAGK